MLAPMRPLALLLLIVLLAACGGDDEGAATGTTAGKLEATALITTAGDEVELSIEVADDEAERARGPALRRSLDNAGMVFLYPEPTEGSFWMKNTPSRSRSPSSTRRRTILRILDMEPCREDPCPLYTPASRSPARSK